MARGEAFEKQRLMFAANRLGLQTAEDLERWLTRDEKPLPPDERDRRRAEFQKAVPRLRVGAPHAAQDTVRRDPDDSPRLGHDAEGAEDDRGLAPPTSEDPPATRIETE